MKFEIYFFLAVFLEMQFGSSTAKLHAQKTRISTDIQVAASTGFHHLSAMVASVLEGKDSQHSDSFKERVDRYFRGPISDSSLVVC